MFTSRRGVVSSGRHCRCYDPFSSGAGRLSVAERLCQQEPGHSGGRDQYRPAEQASNLPLMLQDRGFVKNGLRKVSDPL
jgi:hypothetical protein